MSSPIHHFLLTYILEAFFLAFLSYIGNPQLLIKQEKLTERDTNIVNLLVYKQQIKLNFAVCKQQITIFPVKPPEQQKPQSISPA